jgi:thioredoxin reductase
MKVDERHINKFILGEKNTGVTIIFEDGSEKYEAFLAHNPEVKLRSIGLVEQLGLDVAPQGHIAVQPPFGEANVPGVFVAGDAGTTTRMIPQALTSGTGAASGAAGHVQSRMLGQASMGDFLRAAAQTK